MWEVVLTASDSSVLVSVLDVRTAPAILQSMTDDATTIHVSDSLKDALDDAAASLFSTTEVPYRVTIERLLKTHDEVEYANE